MVEKKEKTGLSKVFDILSKIAAIVVLLAFVFQNIVGLGWLDSLLGENLGTVTVYVGMVIQYAGLVLAILVGLEFGTNHGFIAFIIMAVVIALVIIPIFFTDAWAKILEMISSVA